MTTPMQIEDFDSTEEWEFYNWLLEAEKHGIVSEIKYHPKTYVLSEKIEYPEVIQLKTKTKIVRNVLLGGCEYTPDFQFKVHNDAIQKLLKKMHTIPYDKTIVDTKGSFGSSKNTAHATFPIKAKWLFQTQGIYVQKVVPEKLFKKTWVPGVARYTPKRKDIVKKYINCKTIKEFIN